MRGLGCLLVLGLVTQTFAARELKWGWQSAASLGQLTTATGANTNAGMLSTVNPGQGNDAGMLAGGSQTGGLGNADANSAADVAQPPLPPGMALPPAIPGTPAYARQQAALRRVRAHAPAPSMWYAAAPGADFADAPAEAAAEAPTVYVSRNAAVFGSASAPTPGVAPFGVEAPAASAGFMPLTLGSYPGTQAVQLPVSQAAAGYMDDSGPADSPPAVAGDMAPGMAPSLAPTMASNMAPAWAPRVAPAPAPHRAHAPAPAPTRARRAPAPAPTRSGPFAALPDPFSPNAAKLIWTAGRK